MWSYRDSGSWGLCWLQHVASMFALNVTIQPKFGENKAHGASNGSFHRIGLEVLCITFAMFLRGGEVRFREGLTSLRHIPKKSFQRGIWRTHSLSPSPCPLCSIKNGMVTTGLNNSLLPVLCALTLYHFVLIFSMSSLIPETLENRDGLKLCTSYLLPSYLSSSTMHLIKAIK